MKSRTVVEEEEGFPSSDPNKKITDLPKKKTGRRDAKTGFLFPSKNLLLTLCPVHFVHLHFAHRLNFGERSRADVEASPFAAPAF